MNLKDTVKKLYKTVQAQQKILEKMAQTMPPQHLDPVTAPKREAEVILNALAPQVRADIDVLEVQLNVVSVRFKDGRDSDYNEKMVMQTVQALQQSNQLRGKSYTFKFM